MSRLSSTRRATLGAGRSTLPPELCVSASRLTHSEHCLGTGRSHVFNTSAGPAITGGSSCGTPALERYHLVSLGMKMLLSWSDPWLGDQGWRLPHWNPGKILPTNFCSRWEGDVKTGGQVRCPLSTTKGSVESSKGQGSTILRPRLPACISATI